MAGYRLLESRNLSQAEWFLGACLSRAQHRTAGMEAAARGDVGRIWRLACQNLVGPATTDLRGYGEQRFRVWVQGLGEHRLRRSKLDWLAQIHARDPVGERPGEGEVVGDEDRVYPVTGLEGGGTAGRKAQSEVLPPGRAGRLAGLRDTHVALHRPPTATLVHTIIDCLSFSQELYSTSRLAVR